MSEQNALMAALAAAVGADRLSTDPSDCMAYGFDNSRRSELPAGVVRARDVADVAATIDLCRQYRVPLTVRGRGTNTVGATVPIPGGVVLSLETMTRVIEYAPEDRYIVVEAGCLNNQVQDHVRNDGLFWAPDPTSAAYSSVGGNLGCNAGGPRAVRYGTCRDNVLGLEAVLGDGSVIRVGSRTTKSVVGLDFTRLLIGAEGTLGVITQATLRLSPLPAFRRSVRVEFRSVAAAARAVSSLLRHPDTPAICEFMDDRAVELVRPDVSLHRDCQALLLLECHGNSETATSTVCASWREHTQDDQLCWHEASSDEETQAVWAARKALSPRLRSLAPDKTNEDVVVPVSRIPKLIERVRDLSDTHGIPIVCFGHAGNGNLHVNLMYDRQNEAQAAEHDACLEGVFAAAIELGGSLSGEHGVGLAKRDFVGMELDTPTLAAMRAVKRALDPDNILNPDKGLPAAIT